MTDIEKVIREVARYCGQNSQTDPYAGPPYGHSKSLVWTVNPQDLMRHLQDKFKVNGKKIYEWSGENATKED